MTATTVPSRADDGETFAGLSMLPRFLLFPILATFGYIGLINHWGGDAWWVRGLWVIGLSYCWFCIGGTFHETVHHTLFRRTATNVWLGRVLGTFIGIPYTAYRETHRRHHAYLNTPDDFEMWPYSDPHASLTFRRIFVWIDLFAGIATAPIVYGRIYFVPDSPLSADVRRTIRNEYLGLGVYWLVLGGLLTWLTLTGTIEWTLFDPLWLLPMVISSAFNSARKFTEHLGMASIDPIQGTRTVIGGNPITRLCSYFNFDIYIHGPHHRYPRAQHFELERRMAEYRTNQPDAPVPLFSTYWAAILDMLPSLWTNPGVGANVTPSPATHS